MNTMTYDSRLFAELYDQHPQAIMWFRPIWNEDGNSIVDFEYTYCNEEALRYLNLTPEQLEEGLRITTSPSLVSPLREQILEEMIRVYETGQKSEYSVYNPALDKHARVLRTRLRDGILSVIEDLTEENRIIRQLEERTHQLEEKTQQVEAQKNLLDNILQNSSNGISVSKVFRDENGVVIDAQTILANDAAVKYIGFPKEIYLTKRASEIEPAVIGSPYYQACVKTLETGEPFVMQYQVQATNRWLELTVSKMDYDHLIHVFSDVTPIKEAQLKLEQSVDSLRRTNENLEEFTRAASHDLKEPIRKVQFFTDRLKTTLNEKLSPDERQLLERVETAAARMKLLVDDLLEYSHIDRADQHWEEIDLNRKIQLVLTDLELLVAEKRAVFNVGPLPVVKGYRRQLQQLFQNLISNALKYTAPGNVPVINIRSQIATGEEAGNIVTPEDKGKTFYLIEVQDNGIGFDQQYADKIFNVFTRLHGNIEYSGTGVGLAIVKKVVENHHGYIWAESEPGKGATFKVLLPVE